MRGFARPDLAAAGTRPRQHGKGQDAGGEIAILFGGRILNLHAPDVDGAGGLTRPKLARAMVTRYDCPESRAPVTKIPGKPLRRMSSRPYRKRPAKVFWKSAASWINNHALPRACWKTRKRSAILASTETIDADGSTTSWKAWAACRKPAAGAQGASDNSPAACAGRYGTGLICDGAWP